MCNGRWSFRILLPLLYEADRKRYPELFTDLYEQIHAVGIKPWLRHHR